MLTIDNRRALLAARRRFFDGQTVPRNVVPASILNSWRRCSALGLDITSLPRLEPMTSQELRELTERNDLLRRLCRSEIEALHAEARSTDCIVILSDADGLVLDTVGAAGFADRAARVALRPGVAWAETATGTNAIGAALIEKRPIRVHGMQHYFEPHGFLSCSAAPIFDPQGRIAGALDMSGPATAEHGHALGLVRMAVDQIEHRFFEQNFEHCDILRFHSDPGLIGTTREGILVFQDRRVIAGNRHGLDLLDLDWSALNRHLFDDLFAQGSLRTDGDIKLLRSQRGDPLYAHLQAPARPTPMRPLQPARHAVPMPVPQLAPVFNKPTRDALARVTRLIDADIPVLLQGETGTGKEVFAREMHRASRRADRPFIAVNCAALPEGLIESELFGYEEGAFSGARRRGSKGLIREAADGVLFLDEIGDMPLPLQSRLLRVLQEREVRPLGGGAAVPVDFVLICATHRDLREMAAAGAFRSDLYFRIAQYTQELTPLRNMPDLPSILRRTWRDLAGDSAVSLSPASESLLLRHDWPGNFRQLISTLRALIALADRGAIITPDMLPAELRTATPSRTTASSPAAASPTSTARIGSDTADGMGRLRLVQQEAMQRALAECNGNVSRAARKLGINRSTIYRYLQNGTLH